jgi:hypothetical protein
MERRQNLEVNLRVKIDTIGNQRADYDPYTDEMP